MPSTRRQKRVQEEEALGAPQAKRAPRPNRNTLADFNPAQQPLGKKRSAKSKASTSKKSNKALAKSTVEEERPETPMLASSAPPSSPFPATPLANRVRQQQAVFDPRVPGKHPHIIIVEYIPIINRRKQPPVGYEFNANRVTEGEFPDLVTPIPELLDIELYIQAEFVNDWTIKRSISHAERPKRVYPWTIVLGKGVASSTRLVKNQGGWVRLLSLARQWEYNGGTEKKNAHFLTIEAVYEALDYKEPELPILDSKKRKDQRAHTVKLESMESDTPFVFKQSTTITISSDTDATPTNSTKGRKGKARVEKLRDSTTNRQLAKVADTHAKRDEVTVLRSQIFHYWRYIKEDYGNGFLGACYRLQPSNTHHKLGKDTQKLWAEAWAGKLMGVSVEKPPHWMLAKFMEGWEQAPLKKSTSRKPDTSLPTPTPNPSPQNSPGQVAGSGVHIHLPASTYGGYTPTPSSHVAQPAGQPVLPLHRESYYQTSVATTPGPSHKHAPVRASSPMVGMAPTPYIQKFSDFLCEQHPNNPTRQKLLRDAISTMVRDLCFEVEQLQGPTVIQSFINEGVKPGIALELQARGVAFRARKKAEDAATGGLAQMAARYSKPLLSSLNLDQEEVIENRRIIRQLLRQEGELINEGLHDDFFDED